MKNTLLTLALALVVSNANAGVSGDIAKNPVLPPPVAPAPACNNISYNFFEASWLHSFAGEGADGFGVALNKSIAGNLFATADYNQFFSPDQFDVAGGLGYFVPVTSCVHWVTKASLVYSETDFDDAFSGSAGTGFRIGLSQWLQLDVFYHAFWYDFDELTHSGSAALIFREILAPNVDVIVSGSAGEEDYQAISAGFRYNF
ncbi:MAG: hypothetical protein JNJ83_24215 [Verrucomicrobiaceae bacterium]|nr:hypothetical protein [Verrucomicrobiaceae bacterium]